MTNRHSVLRWHGGKRLLAPWIIQQMPSHRTYVEPYAGGASVLMLKGRTDVEVYNDLDSRVVTLFRMLRDRGADLQRAVELTPFSREEFQLAHETCEDELETARRLLVRAAMGRASASATNAYRATFRGNVGASRGCTSKDWDNYSKVVHEFTQRLKGVVIENRDALEVMAAFDSPTTLHYVDPPYVSSTRDKVADYRHEMDDDDHEKMLCVLCGLKGKVMLSGYASALYDRRLIGWTRLEKETFADNAVAKIECLWLSPGNSRTLPI